MQSRGQTKADEDRAGHLETATDLINAGRRVFEVNPTLAASLAHQAQQILALVEGREADLAIELVIAPRSARPVVRTQLEPVAKLPARIKPLSSTMIKALVIRVGNRMAIRGRRALEAS